MLEQIIDWEHIRCPQLLRVRTYVLENLGDDLTLRGVAAVAGMERTYFCAYFKMHTGATCFAWIRWERIRAAAELFESPPTRHLSRDEVADRVGFGHVCTLDRNFKRLMGVTVGAFRRQLMRSEGPRSTPGGGGDVAAAVTDAERTNRRRLQSTTQRAAAA